MATDLDESKEYYFNRTIVRPGINPGSWLVLASILVVLSTVFLLVGIGNYILFAILFLFFPFYYSEIRSFIESKTNYTMYTPFVLTTNPDDSATESESDKRKRKEFINSRFSRDQEVFYVLYRYLEFSKNEWKGPNAYKGDFVNYMINSYDSKIPRNLFERNIDGFHYKICPQDIAWLFCGHSKYLKDTSSEVLPYHLNIHIGYNSDQMKDTILGLVTFSRRMKIGNLTQAHFGTNYYDPEAIDTSSRQSYIEELQLKAQVDLELEQAKPERGKLLTLEDRIDMALKEKEEQQNAEEVTALLGKTRKKRIK